MIQKLIDHIVKNLPQCNRVDLADIERSFSTTILKKKDHYLKMGTICRYGGFVVKGCFRNYVISSEGKEINTQFGFENWWIGDIGSFVNRTPSQINVQALEDCYILTISANDHEALLAKSECFTEYTRKLRSSAHLAAVMRYSKLSEHADKRYELLLENYPGIEQRISQKHIASYLQITPEALSRLKKSKYESNS